MIWLFFPVLLLSIHSYCQSCDISSINVTHNTTHIVNVQWIRALLNYRQSVSASPPENYPYSRNHAIKMFETNFGPVSNSRYKYGHIPGAIYSDSDAFENGCPRWNLLPKEMLINVATEMGISIDTTVVIYSSSFIHTARLWFILKYIGVVDVRFLNGML